MRSHRLKVRPTWWVFQSSYCPRRSIGFADTHVTPLRGAGTDGFDREQERIRMPLQLPFEFRSDRAERSKIEH